MEVIQNNTLTESPIKLTPGAIKQLKKIRAESDADVAPYLRVGVKGGGCSGLSYLLAFDQKTDKDKLFHISGFDLIMDQSHVMYVLGMEVDYADGLNSRGFEFINPNAKETCGCGTSFSS